MMSSRDTIDFTEKKLPEQQMLTSQEISDRRKARRMLDKKGIALEEAVERRVCERVYKRIWRHQSTLDEVRDEKLRSRTAALALVGIGLQDLGIEFNQSSSNSETAVNQTQSEIERWISKARDGLLKMNDAHYPLGKLEHLAATHKSIVDLLTHLHQSSSSADEILPTLIYTLITTPPEGINVISNLHFTQRFRAANKIDGEAAYCLTNLEAAITFLETVDLATLRSDEPLEGPPKNPSRPSTPRDESLSEEAIGALLEPEEVLANSTPSATITQAQSKLVTSHPLESPSHISSSRPPLPSHTRRSSNLLQPPMDALGAASDRVRSTADQGFKTIGNTLDNSFKFLFGRLKEHSLNQDDADTQGGIILPRTLDDARKLVDPNPVTDEEGNTSEASSVTGPPELHGDSSVRFEDRILGMFAGHRDRSADSIQSSGSGKRVAFTAEASKVKENAGSPNQTATQVPASSTSLSSSQEVPHLGNAAVESMRNLGNTLNPLNRFAGMNVMRGFGRSASTPSPAAVAAITPPEKPASGVSEPLGGGKPGSGAGVVAPRVAPPSQKFLDVADVAELKIGEVAELLQDYRRLAAALQQFNAF